MHRTHRNCWQALATVALVLLLSACGSLTKAPVAGGSAVKSTTAPALPPAGSGRGGYYQDDGPAEHTPDNLIATPDAVPVVEPIKASTSRPYVVLGKTYTPITNEQPFKQRGMGTWYGKKFHGQKTSSGERYDMFKMTAAHPTLPIPSYARVTNLTNGASVIVRINDRGPFHSSRIIDLSYTAALKLGYLGNGSGMLEVERLLPEDIARINNERAGKVAVAQAKPEPLKPEAPKPDAAMPRPEPDRGMAASGATAVVAMPIAPVERSVATPITNLTEGAPVAATRVSGAMSSGSGNAGAMANAAPVANPSSAPAMSAAAAAAVAAAPPKAGIYLQFGAFAHMANAEAIRDRLASAWNSGQPQPEVIGSGSLYRVTSGPFASRQDAEALARQVGASTGFKAVVVQR